MKPALPLCLWLLICMQGVDATVVVSVDVVGGGGRGVTIGGVQGSTTCVYWWWRVCGVHMVSCIQACCVLVVCVVTCGWRIVFERLVLECWLFVIGCFFMLVCYCVCCGGRPVSSDGCVGVAIVWLYVMVCGCWCGGVCVGHVMWLLAVGVLWGLFGCCLCVACGGVCQAVWSWLPWVCWYCCLVLYAVSGCRIVVLVVCWLFVGLLPTFRW